MSTVSYSFLDVAVLDEIRQRFAAGDAVAVLSADLEQVIWANGPGAAVFGYPDIEAIIGASAGLPPVARRQIMATAGFPEIGRDRAIMVRLATGMTSRAVGFLASAVTMPDGEQAIMLAVPATQAGSRSAAEIAARAISGFTEDGHFIAFIDGNGAVEAASDGFSALGITGETLAALVADVANESDRIVKRLVPAGPATYPAGLARLTDDPARHLLVVIDEDQLANDAGADHDIEEAQDTAEVPAATATDGEPDPVVDQHAAVVQGAEPALAAPTAGAIPDEAIASPIQPPEAAPPAPAAEQEVTGRTEADQGEEPTTTGLTTGAEPTETSTAGAEPTETPVPETAASATEPDEPTIAEIVPQVADSDRPTDAGTPSQHDHWYFNADGDDQPGQPPQPEETEPVVPRGQEASPEEASFGEVPPEEASPREALQAGPPAADEADAAPVERAVAAAIDRASAPVRFVWRTDAQGRFSAISPEFAETVGKPAADIIGQSFKDVAEAFGLDPSGEIAGLLERRDTWSGRSVLWPVAGADLKIPVDLAALPIYGRSRAFEGFRGFGVARTADAVIDPQAIGLTLVPDEETLTDAAPAAGAPLPETPSPEAPISADPFKGEVPALTIVPKQERRFADKVIRLAEHRQPANDKGLSTLERSAFREIGERLKKESTPETVAGKPPEASKAEVVEPAAQVPPASSSAGPAVAETPPASADDFNSGSVRGVDRPNAIIPHDNEPAASQEPTEPTSENQADTPVAAAMPDIGEPAAHAVGDTSTDNADGVATEPQPADEAGPPADAVPARMPATEPGKLSGGASPLDHAGRNSMADGISGEVPVELEASQTQASLSDATRTGTAPDTTQDIDPAGAGDAPVDDDAVEIADHVENGSGPAGDGEEIEDAARPDGERPASASRDEPAEAASEPGRPGSLLDYAERSDGPAYIADNSDEAPLPATGAVAAGEIADRDGNGGQPAAGASLEDETDALEGDDSAALAEFGDAEDADDLARLDDDGDPTVADERQAAETANEAEGADGEFGPPAERPRLQVPPLRTEGFLPSAFSTGEARHEAPDISILGKLPVPLLIHSGDVLHYANEQFLNLTGYGSLGELDGAGGLGALFADPYADDGASDATDRALKLTKRDGLEFPVEAILRSVPWHGGKALMLVVHHSGEAEERETAPAAALSGAAGEQTQPDIPELKARVAEMRTIIDTATDGVVLIGRDGTIRSISRPAEALFGFDSDEVAGKPFASLFAIESQRAARDYLTGLSEPGVASVLNDGREVIGREAQGRFIPLFMTIGRLPNDSGYCAVVRDITQWKRAEEDLTQARAVAERASSQKTDFLARISHEIRTPLNAIIGFSELMVDEKFGPVANDRYRDYLRDINRSGNHVLDLVNDLLDISKIEAGQQEMDYEAVSLNDTLAETVAMMQPQANRERVIIRSSFASKLPEVVADLRSVRQIALNILSNAIRYTQAGGQVIVSTAYEPSGDVVMRVRDTGIGMSQAEIEQALKPFKQINALKRGRGDGTGLGLPLTKAMVEANRARFSINSTPGEGTLVEVAFPSTRVLAD